MAKAKVTTAHPSVSKLNESAKRESNDGAHPHHNLGKWLKAKKGGSC